MHAGKIREWILEQNEDGDPVVAVVQPENRGAPVRFEIEGSRRSYTVASKELTALWLAVFYLAEVADSAEKAVAAVQSIAGMGQRVRSLLAIWKWRPPRS